MCFKEDDTEEEAREFLANVKRAATRFLLNPTIREAKDFYLTEDQIETMLSSCPNVPGKSFHKPKGIFGLYVFSTDNNCSIEDLNTMDQKFTKCFKDENQSVRSQVGKYISSQRGSIQSRICSLLNKTVGKCLRLKLPSCLSKREKAFISSSYKSNIREGYEAVEYKPGWLFFS